MPLFHIECRSENLFEAGECLLKSLLGKVGKQRKIPLIRGYLIESGDLTDDTQRPGENNSEKNGTEQREYSR